MNKALTAAATASTYRAELCVNTEEKDLRCRLMFDQPRRFTWNDWQILEEAFRDEQIHIDVVVEMMHIFLRIQEEDPLDDIITASVI